MSSSLLNPVPTEQRFSGNKWTAVVAAECFVHLLLAIGGGFLLFRRIQGGMTSPASFGLLSITGVVLASWLLISVYRSRVFPEYTASVSLGVLASILIATAISIPESSVFGEIVLWLPILASAGYVSWMQIAAQRKNVEDAGRTPVSPVVDEDGAEYAGQVVNQSITRILDDDGTEVISGKVRCHFEPNERFKNAHIGFCPVLDVEPEVFVELADGPDGEVTVGQVLCTGIRFDVKIQPPATEQASVLIEFYAKCPKSNVLNS